MIYTYLTPVLQSTRNRSKEITMTEDAIKQSTPPVFTLFTYLFLLTRPHKRRLFMAGLVRKHNNPPRAVYAAVFCVASAAVFLLFILLFSIFFLFGVDRRYYTIDESSGIMFPFFLYSSILSFAILFPYASGFYGDKRSFFLRYSYYSQTPSFQNPTKRRQILLLDTVTRYGTRWTKGDLLMLALLPVMFFLLWLNSTFLPGFSTVFYTQSTVFLLLVILIYCLWLFGYNSPPIRKLLYNLHIRRHGPIPKELTDIVTQAYEIYPQVTT
ncbi:putative integral membrane protein [Tropheryma whipplei TW08/27]|nr:putative integral membrane protein [Tropheryma whipplei TW08/27]